MSRESKRLKAAARFAEWKARTHVAGFKVPQQRTEGTMLAAENIRACQAFAALPPEQKPEKEQPIARDFAPLPLTAPLSMNPNTARKRALRARRAAERRAAAPPPIPESVTTDPNRDAHVVQRVL